MMLLCLVLLGLAFGSFVNALVYRLSLADDEIDNVEKSIPRKKLTKDELSISKGRSVCISCGHQLEVRDLVPVLSWLSLKGRCRHCGVAISWQYPAVELITALIFVISFIFWPSDLADTSDYAVFGLWLVMSVGLVAMAVYDIRWMLIPDRILKPIMLLSVASVVLQAVSADDSAQIVRSSALGLILVGGFFLCLYYGSRGKWIGGGDVKLLFFMSFYLGAPDIFVTLAIAFYGAFLIILPLILFGYISRKQRIAFGPFLIAGFIAGALFADQIIELYNELFLIS